MRVATQASYQMNFGKVCTVLDSSNAADCFSASRRIAMTDLFFDGEGGGKEADHQFLV